MNLLGCVLFSHFEVTYHDAITCQCFNEVLPKVDTLSTAVVRYILANQPRYLLTTPTCLTRLLSSSKNPQV